MCPSLSKKNIIKNHLNRLKQGEGLLKIFAITKLKTYYGNALPCVTGFKRNFVNTSFINTLKLIKNNYLLKFTINKKENAQKFNSLALFRYD
jgi:hypothetical protein